MNEKLLKKLRDREEKGTKRSLSSFEGMVDLLSNDYLGFASEQFNIKRSAESGATGSRLISGNNFRLEELEKQIAEWFGFSSGLFFNSGYDANLGIFSSVPQRGDVVLYDELVHASIRDGIRLSFADAFSFRHNDMGHLEERLQSVKGDNVFIAVEGLYSMNGDFGPLVELNQLALRYGAKVILDEAHSAGVKGVKGKGVLDEPIAFPSVIMKLVTFGKALGSHGAIVLTDELHKEYLVNFARSFIYTTALPNGGYDKVLQVLDSDHWDERRNKLHQNIAFFNTLMSQFNIGSSADSPIKIIDGISHAQIRKIEEIAKEKGIALKGIFPPTVPEGNECIRISLHSFNTSQELELLKEILEKNA